MKFIFVISDHGFGHAARNIELMNRLLERGHEILLFSNVDREFFEEKIITAKFHSYFRQESLAVDPGLVQEHALSADYRKSVDRLQLFWKEMPDILDKIEKLSHPFHADLIFFDISPLAPLLAERLHIPSIAMSNFSWDWIYADLIHYFQEQGMQDLAKSLNELIPLYKESYAKTNLLLRLPFSPALDAFTCSEICVPWTGNLSKVEAKKVRMLLDLPLHKKIVLFSLGGHELPKLELENWTVPKDWRIVLAGRGESNHHYSNGVFLFTRRELIEKRISYTDVLNAVDVVVTKPGYGIVSESIFHKKPMLYLDRGRFAEYPYLVNAIHAYLPAKKIEFMQLARGDLYNLSEELLRLAMNREHCIPDEGSARIAKILENFSNYC